MIILVQTDNNIKGSEELDLFIEGVVSSALKRFQHRLSRVTVHLQDVNGTKSGPDDKLCTMEARVEGRRPTAVTHFAPTLELAVDGAVEKLKRNLTSTLEQLHDTHR